jgi:hypothetical protein
MTKNCNNAPVDRIAVTKTGSEQSNILVLITAGKEAGEVTEVESAGCAKRSGTEATFGRAGSGRRRHVQGAHLAARIARDPGRGAQTK